MRPALVLLLLAAPAFADEATVTCPESTTVLPQPQSGCPPAKPWLRAARIGVELVLGGALGALGELIGAYAGINVDILSHTENGAGLPIGASLGAVLTVAPAVWLGGGAMGGDGSFGWTLLGNAAGTVLSAIIIAIKNTTATWVIAAAFPVLGSIAGYELSSNPHRTSAPPPANGVTLVPTGNGIAGTF